MQVSVAMATYNGAKYLQAQLRSLVEQDRPPDELVVSDDASTDATWDLLHAFAGTAPFRVALHRNAEQGGYAKNFARALSLCRGDLVFLCDQDDVWFPAKISRMVAAAEADEHGQLFMNDALLTHEDLTSTGLTKLQQIRAAKLAESAFVMGCCAAVRADFLKHALPIPPAYRSHDTWLVHLAAGLGRRRLIEEPLQYYRRYGTNVSQFIANRTERLSRLSYLRHRLAETLTAEDSGRLIEETARTEAALERVRQLSEGPGEWAGMAADLDRYAAVLVARTEACHARIELRGNKRLRRILPVARMLARRQYAHFSGATSAWRDILLN